MCRRAIVTLAMLVACGGTEPTIPSNQPQPSGWIYFGSAPAPGRNLQRVNVVTGEVEEIPFTDSFPAGQTFLTLPGMVSPVDGRVSAQGAIVWKPWPQTFVYDPNSGELELRGDPAATRDFGHVWSPDGRYVVFERHLATGGDGRSRIVRLDVGTGITDTILAVDRPQYPENMVWLGNDTLLLDYFAPPEGTQYRTLDLQTAVLAPYREFAHEGFSGALSFSSTGHWVSRWSLIGGLDGTADSVLLTLTDRTTDDGPRRVRAIDYHTTDGSIAVAFSPNEAFLANCPANDALSIVRVADLKEVRRLQVPLCFALSWSRR